MVVSAVSVPVSYDRDISRDFQIGMRVYHSPGRIRVTAGKISDWRAVNPDGCSASPFQSPTTGYLRDFQIGMPVYH